MTTTPAARMSHESEQWEVVEHPNQPHILYVVPRGKDRFHEVAVIYGGSNDCWPRARLIAAAPDLLEALTLLMDHQNGCPLPKYEQQWTRAMTLGEAAIAKATGS